MKQRYDDTFGVALQGQNKSFREWIERSGTIGTRLSGTNCIAYEIGTNNLPERHSKCVICNLVTPKVDLFLSDGTAISASTDPLASLKALSVASTSNEHDELIVELQRSKGAPGGSLNGVIVDLQTAEQISSGHLPLYVTTDGVLLGIATRVPTILAQLIGDQ